MIVREASLQFNVVREPGNPARATPLVGVVLKTNRAEGPLPHGGGLFAFIHKSSSRGRSADVSRQA